MKMEKAIIKTLRYHDLFEYPMRELEIYKFLIQASNNKHPASPAGGQITNADVSIVHPRPKRRDKSQISNLKLQTILRKMQGEGKIGKEGEYYFLKGREKTVSLRLKRERYSKKKMETAKKIAGILAKIPFVKMVGVTGALSMNNSTKDDDIDLMIITSRDRLWTTRFFCVFILELMGKRRRPKDKKYRDKICLNMFLDERALRLEKRNLYTAHEVVQMKMVFNRGGCYERFMAENEWVLNYLPNSIEIEKLRPGHSPGTEISRNKLSNYLITSFLNILELILYKLQKWYMRSKITREQISSHLAFFHPKDRGKEILEKISL